MPMSRISAPKTLLNNLMKRTKRKDGAEDFLHTGYYYHNLGAIMALASSNFVLELLTDNAAVLLELCGRGDDIGTLKIASEGLCLILATSRVARKKIGSTGRIPVLANLMDSGNTYVVLSASAAVSVFARSKVDRKLIEGKDVLDLFHSSLRTSVWCMNDLKATREVYTNLDGRKLAVAPDDLSVKIFEYASVALWGFAAVIIRDGKEKELLGEGLDWLRELSDLAAFNEDPRIHSTVTTACSGALSVLCKKLSPELSEIPGMLEDAITNLERAKVASTAEVLSFSLCYLCSAQSGRVSEIMNKKDGYARLYNLIDKWVAKARGGGDDDKSAVSILKNLTSSLMYAIDMEGQVDSKSLQRIVGLLRQRNKGVLMNVVSAIWCLARNESNRDILGKLYVVNGLVQVLTGTSDLELKERILGALWLICCSEKNALRFSMLKGLEILSSFVMFKNKRCYVKVKTLSVCILHEIQRNRDIFDLMKGVEIERGLLDAFKSKYITPYLHVQLAGLVFNLSRDKHFRDVFVDIAGRYYLEDIFSEMVSRDNVEVQCLGVFGVTLLSMDTGSKRHFGKSNCIKNMATLLDSDELNEGDKVKVLHGFLNLSQDSLNQRRICSNILQRLTQLARLGHAGGMLSEFSASILSNLSNNGECRKEMFKIHLAQCSCAVGKTVEREKAKQMLAADDDGPMSRNKAEMAEAEAVKTVRLALGRVRMRINRPVTGLWEDEPVERDVADMVEEENKKKDRGGFVAARRASIALAKGNSSSSGGKLAVTPLKAQLSPMGGAAGEAMIATPDPIMSPKATNSFSATFRPHSAPSANTNTSTSRQATSRLRASLAAKANVLSPLRSSHRVGPVGALGSSTTRQGEDRWRPPILQCDKSLNTFESSKSAGGPTAGAHDKDKGNEDKGKGKVGDGGGSEEKLAQQGIAAATTAVNQSISGAKYTVTLQPPVPYNKITFNTNRHMKGEAKVKITETPVKLVMWKKVEDSVIGDGLYDHFISEEGETFFFYHTSSIVCEALQPGPYPSPITPNKLSHILHESLPLCRDPKEPSDDGAGAAEIARPYIPILPACPAIERHYIPLCSLATKAALRTLKPSLEQVKRANMFGAIPTEPIKLICEMEPEAPSDDDASLLEDASVEDDWDIKKSLFGDREHTADSRSFFDTPQVVRRALHKDFARMQHEPRVAKLISRESLEVKEGNVAIEAEMKRIEGALGDSYLLILQAFDYYCLLANNFTESAFEMGENSYNRFCHDCELLEGNLTSEICQQNFIAVNVESDKKSAESKINDDKSLMRMEFIEIVIRLAIVKYKEESNHDVCEAIKMLIDRNIRENLPAIARVESNEFRETRFYYRDVEEVYLSHLKVLKLIYKKYKNFKPVGGSALFSLPSWMQFLKDSSMIGEMDEGDFTTREAMLAFFYSRMTVIDEVKHRSKFVSLSFTDFLEAIGRVTDMLSVPSDEDMREAKAINIVDYRDRMHELAKESANTKKGRLLKRRRSSNFLFVSERRLAEKLDKVVRLMIGNLGRRNKGNINFENSHLRVVGKYLTQEQLVH